MVVGQACIWETLFNAPAELKQVPQRELVWVGLRASAGRSGSSHGVETCLWVLPGSGLCCSPAPPDPGLHYLPPHPPATRATLAPHEGSWEVEHSSPP